MSSFGVSLSESREGAPTVGIIGGSGLESLPGLKEIRRLNLITKYGYPSDEVTVGELEGVSVAFIPRHGRGHSLPPHKVPYRANIEALKMAGVKRIIGTCIVGSLQREIRPGALVIPDQFVDLTWGRDDTFAQDNSFVHLPMGEPYCMKTRQQILEVSLEAEIDLVKDGTVAVIQGPRFSTAAESRWFSSQGWSIINMTQYPECYFAKEAGLCYAAIAAVTDYAVGLQESLVYDPRNMADMLRMFKQGIENTQRVIVAFLNAHADEACGCADIVVRALYE
ncbi:MAG: MTAP family purine nucleoside phosphorylase [Patescibacteria group bacterium]|nr:MTAP family purine nucleoside phosphorylase [Patescibacteria group bacterium]